VSRNSHDEGPSAEVATRRYVSIAWAFGEGLLVCAAATQVCAAVGFALGGGVGAWCVVVGLAAGAIAAHVSIARVAQTGRRTLWGVAIAIAVLLVFAALLAVSASVYDVSHDGQGYHQHGVLALASGWNPMRQWVAPDPTGSIVDGLVTHYPKGPWILAASVYRATGAIESAKVFNLLLAAAAFALAFAASSERLCAGVAGSLALSMLAVSNPVIGTQLFTFYVDGQIAALVTACICLALGAWPRPQPVRLVAIAAAALVLTTSKFTGLVWAAGFVAALAVVAVWRRLDWAPAAAAAAGLAIGAVGVGFQPYVTNVLQHGDPFYPVSTATTLRGQANAEFLARDRLTKLAVSIFAEADNDPKAAPRARVPFTVSGRELRAYGTCDTHFAGFGPLFSGCLVLAVAVLAVGVARGWTGSRVAAAVAAGLVLSALALSDPWWARFVPQLWLVPLCAVVAAMRAAPRHRQWVGAGLAATVAVNAAVVLAVSGYATSRFNAELAEQLGELREASRSTPVLVNVGRGIASSRVRLREAGVRFVEMKTLPCRDPIDLERTGSRTTFCLPEGAAPLASSQRGDDE
jgi:hypothetical protein